MVSPRHRKKKQSGGEPPSADESSGSSAEEAASELKMHEAMIEALVEELDEKGIVDYSQWEARAKRKLAEQDEAVEDRGP